MINTIQTNEFSKFHDGKRVFFCKTDYLLKDFEKIRKIKNDVILISGNSDYAITDGSQFIKQLPSNVKSWFCTNNLTSDPRLVSLPLGIENSKEAIRKGHGVGWNHAIEKKELLTELFNKENIEKSTSSKHIYANFSISTNFSWGGLIDKICDYSEYITYDKQKTSYGEFLDKILDHRMVVCPLGNAPMGQGDNHKIYETLYCGRVPIVFTKNQNILYNSIYSNLPVICLEDINNLFNIEKINSLYDRIKENSYETITLEFWENIIEKAIVKL